MPSHLSLGDDDRWLARVSQPTRDFVRARARLRQYDDGVRVYAIGDDPDGLYQMLSGEVRLIAYPVVGRQLVTLVARRRHWFGELSVIDRGPRPHDAICHGAVELLHIPMRDITGFAQDYPAILGEIALIGCDHQRAALSFIGTVLSKSAKARLSEMIVAMASRQPGDDRPSVRISQDDLAGRIGVSRQHLSQIIGELRRDGAIATSYGAIHIVDPGLLARFGE